MLRLGSSIRLTRAEQARLQHLIDLAPEGVRTRADLRRYVARCKAHYTGSSEDTRFLHWLIDQELARCWPLDAAGHHGANLEGGGVRVSRLGQPALQAMPQQAASPYRPRWQVVAPPRGQPPGAETEHGQHVGQPVHTAPNALVARDTGLVHPGRFSLSPWTSSMSVAFSFQGASEH